MYNKLKNIIPHRIKVNNFSAKLLDNSDEKMLQDFFNNNAKFLSIDKPINNETLKNKLVPVENNFIIGLFDNSNLISFIELNKTLTIDTEWTIKNFIVDKNYQGKGIATKVLFSLEDFLLSLKSNTLMANVNKNNSCLVSFFQKIKFLKKEENNENIIFIKNLEKKEPTFLDKCFKNGKLVFISSKPEEKKEIYSVIKSWFEKGKKYSELEINSILKGKIEVSDHVTLRRDMVDSGYLNRAGDGKEYWI